MGEFTLSDYKLELGKYDRLSRISCTEVLDLIANLEAENKRLKDEAWATDLLAAKDKTIEGQRTLLRECYRDYLHPSFTDRHGMADRIAANLKEKP